MSEPDYINATNKAYETLINFKEFSFPICVFSVIKKLSNVALHTYSDYAKRLKLSYFQFLDLAPSKYGFIIYDNKINKYQLIYNEKKDDTTIRFTLAHELGHIILGHKEDGDDENKEANCYARNYLCPIPAVFEMGLKTVSDYMECFYVSEPMAEIAVNFKKSDYMNITNANYNNYNDNVLCYMTGISLSELYGYPI